MARAKENARERDRVSDKDKITVKKCSCAT